MSLRDQDRKIVRCYEISPIDLKPEGCEFGLFAAGLISLVETFLAY